MFNIDICCNNLYNCCEVIILHRSEIVINQHFPGLNPVSFGFENCAPSHAYGPALRTHWLLHYVVSGKGIFERGGKTYSLSQGDIFVIPPGALTYYEADAAEPWNYIWIGYNAEIDLPECLSEPAFNCPSASEIFERMKRCSLLENGKSAYLTGCLWELIAIFSERAKKRTDFIDKALSFIYAQYSTDIKIGELAEKLNVDRSHFSTEFRKRLGKSPAQYIRKLRLERAAELMRVYGESPSVAALSVGYDDLAHFSKNFKKQFGVSPREYKIKLF